MIVDKKTRIKIINDYYHRQEEKFLRSIGFTEERIKDIISQSPDYSINEYKGFSVGYIKQDLKYLVTDEYYELGGINFDPEQVMIKIKNKYKTETIISVKIHGRRIEIISIVTHDDGNEQMVSRILRNRLFGSEEWDEHPYYFCPECFSNKTEITAELIEHTKCNNCGWTGEMDELLKNDEEIINHKRSKKLKDILS